MIPVRFRPGALRPSLALVLPLGLLVGCQSTSAGEQRGAPIVATMDSGGYTYVQLAADGGETWYAVPQCKVAVGDRVEVADGAMKMRDFESTTLKRTFPVIYFASGLERVGSR